MILFVFSSPTFYLILLVLVVIILAIVLTMHRTTKVKRQDVFRRNAIDFRRTIMNLRKKHLLLLLLREIYFIFIRNERLFIFKLRITLLFFFYFFF